MNEEPQKPPPTDAEASKKGGKYHHGDLRGALIAEALRLVEAHGAENFSMTDACAELGVSTAAPSRHFRDRSEVLEEVVCLGFGALSANGMAAAKRGGEGTLEGMIEMGRSYVSFAVQRQALFRLMFGQDPVIKGAEVVQQHGRRCFGKVIEQVGLYCERNSIERNAEFVAVQLWTFVHGVASLLIDGDYEKVAPTLDIDGMLTDFSRRMLTD